MGSNSNPTPSDLSDQEKKTGYLFGQHISHSLSPAFHQTMFDTLGLPHWHQHLHDSPSIPSFISLTTSPSFFGSAVTMPHKVAIIPHLHAISPSAKAIGAVNTIYFSPADPAHDPSLSDDTVPLNDGSSTSTAISNHISAAPTTPAANGTTTTNGSATLSPKLIGTNTDCIGIHLSLLHHLPSAHYTSLCNPTTVATIIGGGGTSRAAVYALKKFMGVGKILFLNREESEVRDVVESCEKAGVLERGEGVWVGGVEMLREWMSREGSVKVVVSCVPDFEAVTVGEKAVRDELALILASYPPSSPPNNTNNTNRVSHTNGTTPTTTTNPTPSRGVILEMCYHPSPNTRIAAAAEKAGWIVVPGVEAMIWGGVEQNRLWTGRALGKEGVEKVRGLMRGRIEAAARGA